MKKKAALINFLLILTLFLLLGWGTYSWLNPKFPSAIETAAIPEISRELSLATISREAYSKSEVKDVTRLNLFRKQRRPYYRPKPPKPKTTIKRAPPKVAFASPSPPPRTTAPPPQLVLTGVLLFGEQKIAIFEGTYSEIRGGRLVQNLKPRRRGYKTGESLGEYKIKNIDLSHATLSNAAGRNLTLTLSKTSHSQRIQKSGNQLIHKSKTGPHTLSKTPPPRRTRRSQPIPVQNAPRNSVSSPTVASPSVATPGIQRPAPNLLNSKRFQQLRQKTMGVLNNRE